MAMMSSLLGALGYDPGSGRVPGPDQTNVERLRFLQQLNGPQAQQPARPGPDQVVHGGPVDTSGWRSNGSGGFVDANGIQVPANVVAQSQAGGGGAAPQSAAPPTSQSSGSPYDSYIAQLQQRISGYDPTQGINAAFDAQTQQAAQQMGQQWSSDVGARGLLPSDNTSQDLKAVLTGKVMAPIAAQRAAALANAQQQGLSNQMTLAGLLGDQQRYTQQQQWQQQQFDYQKSQDAANRAWQQQQDNANRDWQRTQFEWQKTQAQNANIAGGVTDAAGNPIAPGGQSSGPGVRSYQNTGGGSAPVSGWNGNTGVSNGGESAVDSWNRLGYGGSGAGPGGGGGGGGTASHIGGSADPSTFGQATDWHLPGNAPRPFSGPATSAAGAPGPSNGGAVASNTWAPRTSGPGQNMSPVSARPPAPSGAAGAVRTGVNFVGSYGR